MSIWANILTTVGFVLISLIWHDVACTSCDEIANNRTAGHHRLTQKSGLKHATATQILNNLLKNYNQNVRPGYKNKCRRVFFFD